MLSRKRSANIATTQRLLQRQSGVQSSRNHSFGIAISGFLYLRTGHQIFVTRKSYDTDNGVGDTVWREVTDRVPKPIAVLRNSVIGGFGKPQLVRPRLNQGAFRLMVTDAYHRRCAVTGERALPALEAAHIMPFAEVQTHEVSNGLLLRADIHRLFDLGYVTVAPDYHFLVSKAIHDEFANGRDYYALNGRTIALPETPSTLPDRALLEKHISTRFRG